MRRFSSTLAVSLGLLAMLGQPLALFAQSDDAYQIPAEDAANGFDPNAILDDRDIFDLGTMDLTALRSFLNQRGALGRMKIADIDGVEKEPAEIIWRVATSYKVNPKYLLALLQKEQSLVEDTSPTQRQLDWAMGFGVCDSCSKEDPRIQAYKGFANQIEYAAKQHRERYLFQLLGKGTTISGYAPGKLAVVDGQNIKPVNNATAMLYTYTPHIHGNLNLWRIWRRWFSLSFPDGTVAQGKSSKEIYLIRFSQKRLFKSKLAAASIIDPSKIVQVEDSQLTAYPDGTPISFPNYSIVETEDGKRYLIDGNAKRLIVTKEAFRRLGFIEDDVIEAKATELASYEDGRDLTVASQFPTGQLATGPDKKLWYVEDGIKREIQHPALINLYFKGRKSKSLTEKQLDTFRTIEPYLLRDGELVSGDKGTTVYVVENSLLRPIQSGTVFEELGWQWRNVIKVPQAVIELHQVGAVVELRSAPKLIEEHDLATEL
ncbi:hypothetical protein IPH19_01185 [Candidatus Uhrbacteria bacterium]|nr:MAG: hypothetical protein IPH19_01185 [Candidatus Uhrbacteria bacterium]